MFMRPQQTRFLSYSENFGNKKPSDLLSAYFKEKACNTNNYMINSFALVGALQDEGYLSLRDHYYFATTLRTLKNLGISINPNSRIETYNLVYGTNFLSPTTPQTDCVLLCNLNYLNANQSPDLMLSALKAAYKKYDLHEKMLRYYQLVGPFSSKHLQSGANTAQTNGMHPAEAYRWTEAIKAVNPKALSSWGHDHHLQAADIAPDTLKALISVPSYDFRYKSAEEQFLSSIALCADQTIKRAIENHQPQTRITRQTTAAMLTNQTLDALTL